MKTSAPASRAGPGSKCQDTSPATGALTPRAAVGETLMFVVRVWREADGFRAAVRRVDDEDTRLFDSTAAVAHYLELSASRASEAQSRSAPRPRDEPAK